MSFYLYKAKNLPFNHCFSKINAKCNKNLGLFITWVSQTANVVVRSVFKFRLKWWDFPSESKKQDFVG